MYEKYITSPVPWIKEIPSHWALIRGKNLYRKMQRPVRKEDGVVTCFRDGTVTLRKNRRTTGFTESLQEIGYQGIKKGDLVIHVMDAFAGSIGVSDSDGKGTPVYNVCQAIGDSNNFYFALLLREMARTGYIQSLYRGIRERSSDFRFEVFASQFYPVPPHDEQEQIVRFLDWKVSAINRLINVKRKQIKQIESLKKTIIHRVVTKGLHNVRMKDSGIEWIGNIPDNWNVAQVRRCYNVILGKMLSPQPSSMADTWEKYVCAKDVHFNGVSLNDLKSMWFSGAEKKQYQLFDGDLLVVEGGAGAGNSAIVRELKGQKIYVQNSIHIIRPKNPAMLNDYLCYWLTDIVGRGYMNYICSVATIPHFTKDKVMSTMMPIPSVEQQCEIVLYLDEQCAKVDNEITAIKQVCEKLQDLKARLISDVVTGKIDVRGVEVPEFAPVEEETGGTEPVDMEDNDLFGFPNSLPSLSC